MKEVIYWTQHAPIQRRPQEIVGSGTDRSLSLAGIRRAEELAAGLSVAINEHKLPGVQTVVTSPLKRAVETSEIFCQKTGFNVEVDERLKAQNFGLLDGLTIREADSNPNLRKFLYGNMPEGDRFFSRSPKGESQVDVVSRILSFINDTKYRRPPVLVVTHGSVLNTVIGTKYRLPFTQWDNQGKEFAGYILADRSNTEEFELIDIGRKDQI